MGLEHLVEDGDGAGGGKGGSSIPCSICLDDVTEYGDRAWAQLQCGHRFHLDCIGSAFNVKGVMQCPNCRKIEKGQWLYADGCRPYPELNIDDLVNDEDLYDLSYSESSIWCPFGGFTRLPAAFDEVEFPTTAYHDLVFSEHASVSSAAATHICPYIAYVQPLQSSTSSPNVADGLGYNNNNNNQWNGQSAPSEVPNSYSFPSMDVHYSSLFQTPISRMGDVDHPNPSMSSRRPPRTNAEITRYPFLVGQSSGSRVGSSMIHPYPGSDSAAARARERSQALQAYFQQPSNLTAIRTPRSNTQVLSSSSDHTREDIYYLSALSRSFQEADMNPFQHVYPVERPPSPFHHGHRHRTPSQTQYWS